MAFVQVFFLNDNCLCSICGFFQATGSYKTGTSEEHKDNRPWYIAWFTLKSTWSTHWLFRLNIFLFSCDVSGQVWPPPLEQRGQRNNRQNREAQCVCARLWYTEEHTQLSYHSYMTCKLQHPPGNHKPEEQYMMRIRENIYCSWE